MAIKKKPRRSKGGTTVNFSGVESGGRKCPDGEYQAQITSAEIEESSSGNPMIVVKWKITEGKFKGVVLYDNISLVPQALWKMKTLLEALGIDAQEEDVEASDYASEMVDQTATVLVTNETYEGEQRPKVTGYGTEGESDEDDDDKEEPRVRNKKKDDDDDDDADDDSDDADDDDDDDDKKPVSKKTGKSKVKEGSRVKFDDGEGHIIKGTVTSLDDGKATVEDKNGDEYEIDAEDVTVL
jgi:Protein of unknown function (DUF669)